MRGPWEVREIQWYCFSPRIQAHGLCRYCDTPASYMRKRGKGYWQAVCEKHAKKEKK